MMQKSRLSVVLAAALVLFAGCDQLDDLDPGEGPASVELLTDAPFEAAVGSENEVRARVLNAAGDPIVGVEATLSTGENSGEVAPATVTSDANGEIAATWTLGTGTGTQELTISVGTLDVVTVTATAVAGPAAALNVTPETAEFDAITATTELDAGAEDEFGNTVEAELTWESRDENVATVDESGVVTATGNGQTHVVASANGLSDSTLVTVEQVAADLSLTLGSDVVLRHDEGDVTVEVVDAMGQPLSGDAAVTLTVSDEAVAEVINGTFVARNVGSATLTATADDLSAEASFTVTPRPEHSVAVGTRLGCALSPEGEASCWGVNWGGQLGSGPASAPSLDPVAVTGGHTFNEISAGYDFVCGVTTDQDMYCWGLNRYGAIGNGAVDGQPYGEPQLVTGGHAFETVGANWFSVCGVTADNDAYCWGLISDGATFETGTPQLIPGGHDFQAVAVGYFQACAQRLDGSLMCWGWEGDGGFGNGSTNPADATSPVEAAGGMAFERFAMDWSHTCAVTEDGTGYCWGINTAGRLGDGTTQDRLTPVEVAGGIDWAKIQPGNGYTCGTATDGTAYCWGSNNLRFGSGDVESSTTPVAVSSVADFGPGIDAGWDSNCAGAADGSVYCWGAAEASNQAPWEEFPTLVSGVQATQLAVTGAHSCALESDGTVQCWGLNDVGQLGVSSDFEATPVVAASGMADIATGFGHTCAIDGSGAAQCWGSNFWGELGTGSEGGSQSTPATVSGGHTFASISGGARHTCAVTADGETYCWGLNDMGQSGSAELGVMAAPTLVSSDITFSEVSAGALHTCGLDPDGNAYCWGSAQYGQHGGAATATCGEAGIPCSPEPVAVAGGLTFQTISAGDYHTCALTAADTTGGGEAYCWGLNNAGQLGNPAYEGSYGEPVPVVGGLTFEWISADGTTTCGGTTAGETYCWGNNFNFQFGNGLEGNSANFEPVLAANGMGFSELDGSNGHSCAISDGDVYCFGYAGLGQLGTGALAWALTPNEIPGVNVPAAGALLSSGGSVWNPLNNRSGTRTPFTAPCHDGSACDTGAEESAGDAPAPIGEQLEIRHH